MNNGYNFNQPIRRLLRDFEDKKSGKVVESRREIRRRFDYLDRPQQVYEDIQPYGKNVIRLQKDSCYHYMKYKDLYSWNSEEEQYDMYVITDTIP